MPVYGVAVADDVLGHGGVIAQEAPPSRLGRATFSRHVLGDSRQVHGDCRLADIDAELKNLAVDPGRTPERVGGVHLPNQVTNFSIYRWSSGP